MALHAAFSWVVESGVPLPELPAAPPGAVPDLRFEVGPPAPGEEGGPWTVLSRDGDGSPWILWRRDGGDRVLRFPGLADFAVRGDGEAVRCVPRGGVPPGTLRHLFLDTVLPCVLNHRGRLVLHGSAVEAGGGAVAFVGDSGAGKSTLAAALAARGHRCLSDDALLLEEAGDGVRIVPAYPGLRLWPGSPALARIPGAARGTMAHYSGKVRVAAPSPAPAGPVPLRLLFLLADGPAAGEGIDLAPLSRRDALVALLARSWFLDPGDPGRMEEEFHRWADSPVLARVRTLRFPREEALLDAVLDAVLAEAAS